MDLKQTLTELGINIGMSVGGFLGSLVLAGRQEGAPLRTQLFSILAGTLSANYLTSPIAKKIFHAHSAVLYSENNHFSHKKPNECDRP